MRFLTFLLFSLPAFGQNTAYPVLTGSTLPATCPVNSLFFKTPPNANGGLFYCSAANTWTATAFVAPGQITIILSGTCPAGFSEVVAMNGKTVIGTLSANGNVGTTGGSDTITPAGTVAAPSFTGAALSPHTHSFSGTVGINTSLVSGGTPVGSNSTAAFTPAGVVAWPVSVPIFTGIALPTHAHELPWQIPSTTTIRQIAVATFGTGTSRAATAVSGTGTANTTSAAVALSQALSGGTPTGSIAWPASVPIFAGSAGTVPAQTFTGSALPAHQHSITPGGSNSSDSAGTPAGTNSIPAFTGTSFDNRSAYIRVIFCSKD